MILYIKIEKNDITQELLDQSLCSDITKYFIEEDNTVIIKFKDSIPKGYESKQMTIDDQILGAT